MALHGTWNSSSSFGNFYFQGIFPFQLSSQVYRPKVVYNSFNIYRLCGDILTLIPVLHRTSLAQRKHHICQLLRPYLSSSPQNTSVASHCYFHLEFLVRGSQTFSLSSMFFNLFCIFVSVSMCYILDDFLSYLKD